jgi:hypothetical protein
MVERMTFDYEWGFCPAGPAMEKIYLQIAYTEWHNKSSGMPVNALGYLEKKALFITLNLKEYCMKLRSRSFSVVACAAAFVALAVSGCGDNGNPVSGGSASIVGTWNMVTVTMGGSVTVTAGPTTMTNVETYNSNFTCTSITNDYMVSPPTRDTSNGTWITSGNKLLVTNTGATVPDTATYAISGNTLTLTTPVPTYGTMTMTFARQ